MGPDSVCEKRDQRFRLFRLRLSVNHVLALFLVAIAGRAQTPPPNVQHRVSPDAYDRAPAAIRAALKKRNCELPETQHWDNTQLNIVRGHFASAAQSDWAAICIAADGTTSALIFWSKPATCPAQIHHGWALNGHFPPGQAGSLYLLKAPPNQILTYRKFFGDSRRNPVIHDGVEIGGEEASIIYYCYHGRWFDLQGND